MGAAARKRPPPVASGRAYPGTAADRPQLRAKANQLDVWYSLDAAGGLNLG